MKTLNLKTVTFLLSLLVLFTVSTSCNDEESNEINNPSLVVYEDELMTSDVDVIEFVEKSQGHITLLQNALIINNINAKELEELIKTNKFEESLDLESRNILMQSTEEIKGLYAIVSERYPSIIEESSIVFSDNSKPDFSSVYNYNNTSKDCGSGMGRCMVLASGAFVSCLAGVTPIFFPTCVALYAEMTRICNERHCD